MNDPLSRRLGEATPQGQAVAIVDAFTAEPFAGNPAGVCPLAGAAPERWMQSVARELSLSETAFAFAEEGGYRLRWFTPAAEVELCGHATMATAHLLWEEGRLGPDEVARFFTLSGELRAERRTDADGAVWIRIDLPVMPLTPAELPAGLLEALGLPEVVFAGRSGEDYLLEVSSDTTVRDLRPDFGRLVDVDVRTVAVTAATERHGAGGAAVGVARPTEAAVRGAGVPSSQPDVVSRFFGPKMGVAEDPVTGFAHCMIGPHWQATRGWDSFLAYQASARGGFLRVSMAGDRVLLEGQAVTVLRGALLATP